MMHIQRTDYPIGLGVINADGSGFTEINRPNSYIRNDQWGRDWENTGSFQIATATPLVKPTLGPPTPTPTTTPISTPVAGQCAVNLVVSDLALRLSPTRYSPRLNIVPVNTTVLALYRLDIAGEDIWYQISYQDQVGWIAAFITETEYVDNINCSLPAPYPSDWPNIAQVTASEIPTECNIDAYLRSEPIALVLARLAYAEAGIFKEVADPDIALSSGGVVFSDAIRIAWIARFNAFLGLPNYGTGFAGNSVALIDQILAPNAFEPISDLKVELLENNSGCNPQSLNGNLLKMMFPTNRPTGFVPNAVELYELWLIYQNIANNIVDSHWNTFPNDLRGFEQFKGIEFLNDCPSGADELTRPGTELPWATNQRFIPQKVYKYSDSSWGWHRHLLLAIKMFINLMIGFGVWESI